MQGITFSGLGSGLDTSAIISQLVALERIPIQQLQGQRSEQQAKLSLIGTFKGLVRDLQTEAKKLSKLSTFASYDVTPSQEGVASFGATGSAAAGSHTLEVTRLAAVDRWAFDGVADPTTQLATGAGESISFSVAGQLYDVAIAEDASSLEEIAAAINGSEAGSAVEATIVNSGTTASPSYQLVLTSKNSGEANRIANLSNGVGGLGIDTTGPDASGQARSSNNITVGSDAVAVIDGLAVTRESNDFNDVIAGVDITLQSVTDPGGISFSVEANSLTIRSRIEDFLDAYNEVVDFVNEQNTYSEESGAGGELFGDSLLRSVRSQLTSALFGFEQRQDIDLGDISDPSFEGAGYATLSVIGIDVDNDGRLSIDSSTFDDKLADNLEAFADLFVDSDGFDNGGATVNTPQYYQDTTADAGIAAILDRTIERMFDTFEDESGNVYKGAFDARTETLQDAIRRFDRQIEDKEVRLDKFEESLVLRFAALEEVIGGLNAQGAALNAALLGLS
jgi:flagellar hook-associated protein 2